jgi:predicted transcriptional regulator
MHSDYPVISPEDLLETVLPQIRGWSAVPVVRRGGLAGLFTTENLHEYLLMRSALASRGENSSFLLETPSRTIPAP